jgi:4-amino-4-deoxy-L-arabinose transferase-like glycosyltransferase
MTPALSQSGRQTLKDLVLLTVLFAVLFGTLLGSRPLSVPDEGRYVEISREMAVTGDYVTPRLNGVKYFEKPVLLYWLEAFSIRIFGLDEFVLRLWPALFALFGCLAVYGAGSRLYGRGTGLIAATVLATCGLYYALSRAIILDMPLSVLLTIALLLFLVGSREPSGMRRRLHFWGFYVFAALAVMTKGLVGLLIPGMIIVAWIALLGEWRLLRSIHLPSGIALFLLVAAPWHILAGSANPEFFNFYFVHEHFLRYLTTVHDRYEPAWYFIPVLLAGLFPWSPFLAQAIHFSMPGSWQERHEHRDALFLVLWAALVFLFFSASGSKLAPYLLPAFPPLALLIGRYLAAAWDSADLPGIRAGFVIAIVVMLAMGVAGMALPFASSRPELGQLGHYLVVLGAVLAAGGAATWLLLRTKGIRRALPALALSFSVFLALGNAPAARIETQSAGPLVDELKSRLQPGDEVACFSMYYQDLPVYLGQRVTVVNWKGELAFGMSVEDTSAWMIDHDTFSKRWNGPNRMYLFTKRDIYDIMRLKGFQKLYFVAGTAETVLLTNKETKP